jgi:superfamily I DNA/RNA helicase
MAGTWWVDDGELNDEQEEVISLPRDGSYLVVGPPGSGKTNILLLRAKYLTLAKKPNILVVVFTKTLRQFIASGGKEYEFSTEKIVTCRKMQTDLLYAYDQTLLIPSGFEEQRKYLADQVAKLTERKRLGKVYDAIFLDEAQDYSPEEIKSFSQLSERLFAVADSRQKIYKGEDPLAAIRSVVDRELSLRYHYRNGRKICELADGIAKDTEGHEKLLATSQYDEDDRPSTVETFQGNLSAQCEKICTALKTQLRVYPKEFLGVVCPKNEAVAQVWAHLNADPILSPRLNLLGDDVHGFDEDRPICVCSIHAAKGLEVRALHIAAADGIKRFQQQRNLAFTAVTRAKTSLFIYHEGEVPGYFQSAIEGLKPPEELPAIKSLFRRKK